MGKRDFFIKFLEVFCDWAWKNLNHQSCWNCWVIFQKFVLSFLRNDNLSFGSLYLLEVKPFSALHPHELIVAYGRGNVTWKVNPMKPLFMCDTSSFLVLHLLIKNFEFDDLYDLCFSRIWVKEGMRRRPNTDLYLSIVFSFYFQKHLCFIKQLQF